MAKRREQTHIFHLYRTDGTAMFLHPFRQIGRLHALLEKSDVIGHYGREPKVESLTMFRNELYRLIEQEVRAWVSDARFIPKFLVSAGVFLLSYLFLSFVVRDPVPVIDELAISLGVSILTFILVGRKAMQSEVALKRRLAERSRVDSIVFTESAFVLRTEAALLERETAGPADLVEQLVAALGEGGGGLPFNGSEAEAEQLVGYLGEFFESKEFRRTEKRLRTLTRRPDLERRERVGRWLAHRKVDVPLLTLYFQLKSRTRTGA